MSFPALPEREVNACSSCGCAISAEAELCADCSTGIEAEHKGHAVSSAVPIERPPRQAVPAPTPARTVSRLRNSLCGDVCPTSSHYVCTRPPGHPGQHQAHGEPPGQPLAEWPRDAWL